MCDKLYKSDAVVLSVVVDAGWVQDKESAETLTDFYNLIAYTLQLGDLFQLHSGVSGKAGGDSNQSSTGGKIATASTGGSGSGSGSGGVGSAGPSGTVGKGSQSTAARGASPSYVFRGLVCYYGKHYVSIFQSRQVNPRFLCLV
jgi:hypothetical protein